MDPLVSFVVPCYKLAHLLPECINSILAQTYQNYEILIMDNCSPDNTSEVVRSFHDPRVNHVRNEVNLGHVRNFNKGIMMARGKYVWLISADDFLRSPHVLERFVDLMERNSHVGYVFCRAIEVQGSKELGPAQWSDCGNEDRIWDGPVFLNRLIRSNCIVMSSAMVRKECYDKVTLHPPDMPHASDWYVWCMFAFHYQVAYFSEPMVVFRVHGESLTTAFNQGDDPVCLVDELTVLWRVARQAKLADVRFFPGAINTSIARLAARALKSGPAGGPRPGLSEAAFEALLRLHVRDSMDEEDLRARVYVVLGDEQFWGGEHRKAAQTYWLGLRLRPWWLKSWVKYLLLRTGGVGVWIRRFFLGLRRSSLGIR